jgi:uncharacterized protein YbcC (UPF0753/DUF2309 family)
MLLTGRITRADLAAVLVDDLGDATDRLIGYFGTRYHLRLAMLEHPMRLAPEAELRWLVAETDALHRFRDDVPDAVRRDTIAKTRHWVMRDLRARPAEEASADERRIRDSLEDLFPRFHGGNVDQWSDADWEAFCLHALWRVCHHGVHGIRQSSPPSSPAIRHRDLLLDATGEDTDRLVHEVLIPFCAAYLDQGLASWPLPHRDEGFFRAFSDLYRHRGGPPQAWRRGLRKELERLAAAAVDPLESIDESLRLLGVSEHESEQYLAATLLALRGWAGMIWQLETRGDRVSRPAPPGSLVEFLAIRLILERLAAAHAARAKLGYDGPLATLRKALRAMRPRREGVGLEQRAFWVFQLAQVRGWRPADLYRLSRREWAQLIEEIEAFSGIERRRVFHLAFERHYRQQTLDAISSHCSRTEQTAGAANGSNSPPTRDWPKFQVICCLDEREESFRRHLEEIAPEVETFSVAGFYYVAMYYRGAAEAHFTPLCPVVIRPQHYVQEDVVDTFEESHRRRTWTRRLVGAVSHRMHVGSRTFAGGAVLAAVLGPLASIPLVARILFPRHTARIRRLAGALVQPPPLTQLQIERQEAAPGPHAPGLGYTIAEMAGIVERLLRDAGLANRLSRLVIVTGHGSSSLNNPHESAHDCGACGGARGGPNARAVAHMANDPRVRSILAGSGLAIPAETVFVGAYHNTCDDSVTFFDLDRLPSSHKAEFAVAQAAMDKAREWSAHERCRRFESAPLDLTSEAALRHVEGRAEDLAQTRPEYGHATNAICIVGRRSRTRGLFCDRRAFLTSYDPTQDDAQHAILTRILQAVFPVCAGINLEYYFSYTDPTGWGCGTKLPHNITSLLGVMDGAASDLRTGLPWQMVEVHEPVRLLFVIETTPQAMQEIMDRNEGIGRLCRNGWVQLATLDPDSPQMHVFRDGSFELYRPESRELPEVNSSPQWYRGWRDFLGYAEVLAATAHTAARQEVEA